MSKKDFGGYKRIVQYFWDPEPRNDDPLKSATWCLGRRYELSSDSDTSDSNNREIGTELSSSTQGNLSNELSISESNSAEVTSNFPAKINRPREAEGGWPIGFLDDFEARIWFTYRSGFPLIRRSDKSEATGSMTFAVRLRSQIIDQGGFSSDTGWGCMIRSGQSLFANALMMLRLGRDWRRGMQQQRERELINLFADDPEAPFSIHRFVEHGALACGKHPGEWFGPSATARCIQALAKNSVATELKVYINSDGADVYEDKFLSLATAENGCFTPTLILVGIRLGIDRVTPVYWEALKASLQLSQSVGIAGGRPSSSHYFVGVQGDSFFFLDPHQPRTALPHFNNVMQHTVEDIDSCHTRRLRRLQIQGMDPSMLIGFLIRSKKDWHEWRRSITEVKGKPVIHVSNREPLLESQGTDYRNAIDDIEILDNEDEEDGELIEHPS